MAYVLITLKYDGDEYEVEVDDSSIPEQLCKKLVEQLKLDGEYSLVPRTNFGLVKNSQWELVELAPKKTIKSIVKKT